MNEPTRLLATPESELERALLNAGRSYTGSGSTRAKTLLALGLTGAATSIAPSAAASSSLTKASLSKVAVALLVIGGAAIPAWRYLNRASSTQSGPPPVNIVSPIPSTGLEQAPAIEPAVSPVESEVVQPPSAGAPSAGAPSAGAPSVRAERRPASAPPLAAELAALDAARTSLSQSDPGAALVALDGYARNFPRGRLKLEAEVLRIGALANSGQTDAARKRAEAFLRHHPDSVLASRVRSYVGL